MTLFEVKLGALAIALVVGIAMVAYGQVSTEDRARQSTHTADRILEAAETYLEEQGTGCPTISSLKRDRHLDRDTPSSDAWGERFRVSCQHHEVSVFSAGADGKLHSADDIRRTRSKS